MLTIDREHYLIFNLNASLYGIEANWVQEIFSLPEVTPIAEAPRDIIGVVNLRGDILPVMDLNLRFGYPRSRYSLTDSVIVLQWEKCRVGIIVNQVLEVQPILIEDIKKELSYRPETSTSNQNFIAGVAKIGSDIVMLLNEETLFSYSRSLTSAIETSTQYPLELRETIPLFSPHATPEEKTAFRERAANLMRPTEKQDFAGLIPIAVVGLNGEYFGIDLQVVREFTDIRKVTPIPCCPVHIIGNMNLRGEILTLVDIRNLLNMPMLAAENPAKITIVRIEDVVAGVLVDEVFDVMYLHPSEMSSLPAAVHSAKDEYLQGTAPYQKKIMTILDLTKIFQNGELVVNEEV